MKRPDMNAQAQLAYAAWRLGEDDLDDAEAWAEPPAQEQDAWRRAVRLIALLGLEDEA